MTNKTKSPASPTSERRDKFEAWISAPPYERETRRQDQSASWPGQYHDYHVQLAWEAWQEGALIASEIDRLLRKADGAQ